jgi:hypothetical protein
MCYEYIVSYGCSKNWGGVVAKKKGCCKKEKKAFYTLRPTPTPHLQPWLLNGGSQFKDCNPTTSTQYFVLGFILIFFHVPSYFVQDVITQIQDIMTPNPRRHMTQVNGR